MSRFLLPATVILAVSVTSCSREGTAPEVVAAEPVSTRTVPPVKRVLPSQFAGSWYAGDPVELRADIERYLGAVDQPVIEGVHALIQPHAGYRFSGQVAAHGIRQVAGRTFDRVVVLGPSHRSALRNTASLPDATHYGTPLGETPLDLVFMEQLLQHDFFRHASGVHETEHSVQMQVPLLQAALTGWKLVPIVVGQLDPETTRAMGAALRGLLDEKTLVVASTDFTHYGPNYGYRPFTEDVPNKLRALDMGAYEHIARLDLEGFMGYCHETGATICGRQPVNLLLAMLNEDSEAHLLAYDTSGRLTGDFKNSVSYLSVGFTGAWDTHAPAQAVPPAATLPEQDQRDLLELARKTLLHYYRHGELPEPAQLDIQLTAPMKEVSGAFVTLKKDGNLRGCIGNMYPTQPLYAAVMANAVNAAVHDRRFRPVREAEVPELHFEISALTPPQPVASYKEIILGRHGIILSKHGRRAVYLPQVAPEQGWDLAETLSHLSQKAGLPADAWKKGAEFKVFEAIVFEEDDV